MTKDLKLSRIIQRHMTMPVDDKGFAKAGVPAVVRLNCNVKSYLPFFRA